MWRLFDEHLSTFCAGSFVGVAILTAFYPSGFVAALGWLNAAFYAYKYLDEE